MYYIGTFAFNPNYLQHDGKKGMKWGIRRYQNYDGTLTEEGKRRYGKKIRDEFVDVYTNNKSFSNKGRTPRNTELVKEVAKRIKKENDEAHKSSEEVRKLERQYEDEFYSKDNNKVREKYCRTAAQKVAKEHPEWGTDVERLTWGYLYDDLDQGIDHPDSPVRLWMKDTGKEKQYRQALKKDQQVWAKKKEVVKGLVKGILGEYADEKVTRTNVWTGKQIVEDIGDLVDMYSYDHY